MQFTYESQGINTFLVYEFEESDKIDSITMGMISNNKLEGVIPFNYTQMDNQRLLKFNVSSRVNLEQYFDGVVNRKRLMGVMLSLATAILNAQDYMIEVNSFVWDKKYIFVDVSTAKAELICMPILQDEAQKVDLEAIFKGMFFGVQFDQTENCDYIAKLLGFFNSNTHFSLQEFVKLIKELEGIIDTSAQKAMPSVNNMAPAGNMTPINNGMSSGNVAPAMATPANNVVSAGSAMQPTVSAGAASMPGMTPAGVVSAPMPGNTVPSVAARPAGNVAPAPQMPGQQAANKKDEKKGGGFHLFGGKDKKEKKDKKEALPGRSTASVPGASTNGAPQMPGQHPVAPQQMPGQRSAAPQQKQTQPSAMPQMSPQPSAMPQMSPQPSAMPQMSPQANTMPQMQSQPNIQPASVQSKPAQPASNGANFGETTFLNAAPAYGETTTLSSYTPDAKVIPYLVRYKNNEKIVLNKPVFRIGKEKSYVDYFISDNSAISRSHANILNMDGKFYVIDTNSTNHTFLNGQMLQSNMETEIKHGDKIRLADEEFEFKTF